MKTSQLKSLIKECIAEAVEDLNTPPANWQDGFQPASKHGAEEGGLTSKDTPLRLQSGENPFRIGERWFLYIWDERINDNAVYDFSTDMTIEYSKFQEMLSNMKKKMSESKKKKSEDEKRRGNGRRQAEIDSGYKPKTGGPMQSGKSKAIQRDKKQGRKPVKET